MLSHFRVVGESDLNMAFQKSCYNLTSESHATWFSLRDTNMQLRVPCCLFKSLNCDSVQIICTHEEVSRLPIEQGARFVYLDQIL